MTTITRPLRPSSSTPAGAFSAAQLGAALPGALRKLDPRSMWRSPVMFIVEVGAALTTVIAIVQPSLGAGGTGPATPAFSWSIAAWLWLTVVFANLAESVAEDRGKRRRRHCDARAPRRRPSG